MAQLDDRPFEGYKVDISSTEYDVTRPSCNLICMLRSRHGRRLVLVRPVANVPSTNWMTSSSSRQLRPKLVSATNCRYILSCSMSTGLQYCILLLIRSAEICKSPVRTSNENKNVFFISVSLAVCRVRARLLPTPNEFDQGCVQWVYKVERLDRYLWFIVNIFNTDFSYWQP